MPDITPTARLLLHAFRHFEDGLLDELHEHGFDDVTHSHLNLLRHLDRTGLRLTQLAQDAQISKQAAGKIARELAGKGYLAILDDETDGRAKRVIYTRRGMKLMETAVMLVSQAETRYREFLGQRNYNLLRRMLEKLGQPTG